MQFFYKRLAKATNFHYYPITLCLIVGLLYFIAVRDNKDISERYKVLQKQYRSLSCQCKGIGLTGGFCLKKDQSNVGGNHMWCRELAKQLRRIFHDQTVYDFGAGLGWYGKALLKIDTDGYRVASYAAFDGAENLDDVFPDGFVKYMDLSQPFKMPPRDWVLSIEVGEHIPAKYENNFIQNLHRHNKKGIIVSWAIIGNHIN